MRLLFYRRTDNRITYPDTVDMIMQHTTIKPIFAIYTIIANQKLYYFCGKRFAQKIKAPYLNKDGSRKP